nr:recombination-associated protein RdgC [uncultured Rhodoferax sp.]
MLKNIILYRTDPLTIDALGADEALQEHAFTPCGASQEKSTGWVPPRGEDHGAMLESVGGHWIAKLMIETKAVPGSVIAKKAKERCAHIEATTSRKPGKKETRDIKDDIRLELLPMAFTKESAVLVWIDPATNLLAIDAGSQAKADEVVTLLVQTLPGFAARLINTKVSPVASMAEWLVSQEPPAGFTVDRECELKAADESKAVVKYGKHRLDINEVKVHIQEGKLPTKLAMTCNDRVSFVLTEGLQIKKLAFLDVVFEASRDSEADSFDADVAIATGELCKLIPDLLDALGGEVVAQDAQANEGTAGGAGETTTEPTSYHLGSHVDGPDPLYDKAVEVVLKNQKASISLVQRHLAIGYNRAARLLEDMEKAGIVGRMESGGQRSILKTTDGVVA